MTTMLCLVLCDVSCAYAEKFLSCKILTERNLAICFKIGLGDC